MAILFII